MPSGQPVPRVPASIDVVPRHSREHYAELVEECLEEICAGESYEICLTNTFTVSATIDPLETFRVRAMTGISIRCKCGADPMDTG